VKLEHFRTTERDSQVKCELRSDSMAGTTNSPGAGNGPIDAFVNGAPLAGVPAFELLPTPSIRSGKGAEARAVAYIQVKSAEHHVFSAPVSTQHRARPRSRRS